MRVCCSRSARKAHRRDDRLADRRKSLPQHAAANATPINLGFDVSPKWTGGRPHARARALEGFFRGQLEIHPEVPTSFVEPLLLLLKTSDGSGEITGSDVAIKLNFHSPLR
jgi:hypothetical protein